MEKRKRKYTNGEVTVYWNPELCIHATTCYAELPEVFKPYERPWININGAATERIIEIVKKCPTTALDFAMNKDIKEEVVEVAEKSSPVEIIIKHKGPYIVKGDFTIIDTDGNPMRKKERMALCRCGASLDKPFCDGEHSIINFE